MKPASRTIVAILFHTILLISCKGTSEKSDAVDLKFNLKEGESFVYEMKTSMKGNVQGQKIESEMNFVYGIEVISDVGGLKTIKATYEAIAAKISTGPLNLDLNTDKPQKDSLVDFQKNATGAIESMFYSMKGKDFQLKIDKKGEIFEVLGFQELQNEIVNSLAEDSTSRQLVTQMFNSQFNEERTRKSFSQAFSIYPDRPVKVGESWTRNISIGGVVSAEAKTIYKVKEIASPNVTLEVITDINTPQFKGLQNGTIYVNSNDGLITRYDLEQKLTSPMNMITKNTISGRKN